MNSSGTGWPGRRARDTPHARCSDRPTPAPVRVDPPWRGSGRDGRRPAVRGRAMAPVPRAHASSRNTQGLAASRAASTAAESRHPMVGLVERSVGLDLEVRGQHQVRDAPGGSPGRCRGAARGPPSSIPSGCSRYPQLLDTDDSQARFAAPVARSWAPRPPGPAPSLPRRGSAAGSSPRPRRRSTRRRRPRSRTPCRRDGRRCTAPVGSRPRAGAAGVRGSWSPP